MIWFIKKPRNYKRRVSGQSEYTIQEDLKFPHKQIEYTSPTNVIVAAEGIYNH